MTESILQEAERIINGDRAEQYGDAAESFADIAKRWTIELDDRLSAPVTALDVARMMTQLKMSRSRYSYHRDSYVDGAGYLGLTEKLADDPNIVRQPTKVGPTTLRQWWSLEDVPAGIRVADLDGFELVASEVILEDDYDRRFWFDYAPFTEVLDG